MRTGRLYYWLFIPRFISALGSIPTESGAGATKLGAGDGPGARATLEILRDAHPKLQNQEARLLYARALEAQDRRAEAEEEYQALLGCYAGYEARTRYGLLLLRLGEIEPARNLFEEVVRAANSRRAIVTEADHDWLKMAKANL